MTISSSKKRGEGIGKYMQLLQDWFFYNNIHDIQLPKGKGYFGSQS